MEKLLASLKNPDLPTKEVLLDLARKMDYVLANEKTPYRPLTDVGTPGCLLDFTGNKNAGESRPVMVIPDLHGRCDFLYHILTWRLPSGDSVLEAMALDKLHLVFLGDALHTEGTTKQRWLDAEEAFKNGDVINPQMKVEMAWDLTLLAALYSLKIAFPKNFFYLKGNHENIKNKLADGDYPFRKYASEGQMTRSFMEEVYGSQVLNAIESVEDKLPLVYCGKRFALSHAEPELAFSRDDMIHGAFIEKVKRGLTWTDNGEASDDCIRKCFENLGISCGEGEELLKNPLWVCGHRAITGEYRLFEDRRLLQIHNMRAWRTLYIEENEAPDTEQGFIDMKQNGGE